MLTSGMPEPFPNQDPASEPSDDSERPLSERRAWRPDLGGLLTNLLVVIIIVGPVWFLRGDIGRWAVQTIARHYPCARPVDYEIGHFDERFRISKDDLLAAATDAAAVWENAVQKDLLRPGSGGFTVDLVYDHRQEATDKLKSMGISIDRDEAGYQALKSDHDALLERYRREKSGYDARLADVERRGAELAGEIDDWNRRSGAPSGQFERLVSEQAALEAEITEVNRAADDLNELVDEINALATTLNAMADQLNLGVERYNRIIDERGEQYQEGVYERSAAIAAVTVYEFGSRDGLVRVLAHEFGHALGLEHVDEPGALMNAVSRGDAAVVTDVDRAAIAALCAAGSDSPQLKLLEMLAGWSSAPQRLGAWSAKFMDYEE